ncbi:MAG: hypothetical protein ACFE8O_03065 [Candidatus Hermodarchaeota archaeon]
MNPLQAFPFTNMRMIVDLIAEGETGVRQIAAATGLCSFDSTEVSDMLAYLTTFGRVEYTNGGWVIHSEDNEAVYERFRKRYLKTVEKILEKLSTYAKTIEQLSKETGLSVETVDLFLPFLADITRLGVISRCSTEWPITWCQVSS